MSARQVLLDSSIMQPKVYHIGNYTELYFSVGTCKNAYFWSCLWVAGSGGQEFLPIRDRLVMSFKELCGMSSNGIRKLVLAAAGLIHWEKEGLETNELVKRNFQWGYGMEFSIFSCTIIF